MPTTYNTRLKRQLCLRWLRGTRWANTNHLTTAGNNHEANQRPTASSPHSMNLHEADETMQIVAARLTRKQVAYLKAVAQKRGGTISDAQRAIIENSRRKRLLLKS